jgi:hypothetical protein
MHALLAYTPMLFCSAALAALDEDALGKADGYPLCAPAQYPEARCLVALVSRFDEVFPARRREGRGIATIEARVRADSPLHVPIAAGWRRRVPCA